MYTTVPTADDFKPHHAWCGQDVYVCPDCHIEIIGGDGIKTGAQRMADHARIHVQRVITTSAAPVTATVVDIPKPKRARSSEAPATPDSAGTPQE